jgi:HEAT repeat protein
VFIIENPDGLLGGIIRQISGRPPLWIERKRAIRAFGVLGNDASSTVPTLRKNLNHSDPGTRRAAAAALGALGSVAEEAVPSLIECLFTEYHRGYIFDVLVQIGEPAVPALIEKLRQQRWEVRSAASTGLGRIGLSDDAAGAILIGIKFSENPRG